MTLSEFRSTLPHGERLSVPVAVSVSPLFRSTLPHGERHLAQDTCPRTVLVSIHAPARGATCGRESGTERKGVSIHAPARGATAGCVGLSWLDVFRSTLPHGERVLRRGVPQLLGVSIHAPARGATPAPGQLPVVQRVSIHAPARGATMVECVLPDQPKVSIHAPARGATRAPDPLRRVAGVSIHAPARGATSRILPDGRSLLFRSTLPHGERCPLHAWSSEMSGFDPRSRTGSDGDLGLSTENIARFRSTLPHGERPKRPVGPPICLRFDPRSRTGSDASSVRGVARHRVSIHAPARGATPAPAGDSPAWLFRSTLPHGERASTDRIPGVQRRFDPRSRTGSDAPTSAGRRRWPRFDPRSRTGSDPRFNRGCTVTEFRSTLPHGERSVRSTIPGP